MYTPRGAVQSKARDLKKESSPQREFFTQGTEEIFSTWWLGPSFQYEGEFSYAV